MKHRYYKSPPKDKVIIFFLTIYGVEYEGLYNPETKEYEAINFDNVFGKKKVLGWRYKNEQNNKRQKKDFSKTEETPQITGMDGQENTKPRPPL